MKRLILLIAILATLPFAAGIALAGDSDTAALEIVCSGLKRGDRALYEVYGPDGRKIYSVALQGDGSGKSVSRRITGLKSGIYRVTGTHWDWTYDESPALLELQLSVGETSVFGFTASKRGRLPYNCEEGKLNVFKTQ